MHDMLNVRSMSGTNISTDQALVRAKLNFVLKPVVKRWKNSRKLPKPLDVVKLHSSETQVSLEKTTL